MTTVTKLRCVLDGGRYFEGPRWHAGRLWFVDCMARTLLSLAPSGECEQHAKFDDDTPCGLDVLPDGRIIRMRDHEPFAGRKFSAVELERNPPGVILRVIDFARRCSERARDSAAAGAKNKKGRLSSRPFPLMCEGVQPSMI